MGPVTVVEFEHYVGAHRRMLAAASRVLLFYIGAALVIEIPFMLQLNQQTETLSQVFQASTVQSIKLPKLNLIPNNKAFAASLAEADNAKLSKIIDDFAQSHPGTFKVTTTDLNKPERSTSYGGDDAMVTASTYKMFAAYVALDKVEQGTWSMDMQTGAGSLDYCLQRMILVSDNNCGEAVSRKIGWVSLTKTINAVGFSNTSLDGSRDKQLYSTTNDGALLLSRLHGGKLLNAEHTNYLLDLMKRQTFRGGIPAGSKGSVVANKVGDGFDNVTHNDMAIVYGPKSTYSLVIMTDNSNTAAIKDLAQKIYDFYNL